MTSFLLYYVSGNSERMIFNKNIISNNGQAPFLIPDHEEKCSVVLGCCGFASRMQHAYPKSPILRASTVAQEIISRIFRRKLLQSPANSKFSGLYFFNLNKNDTFSHQLYKSVQLFSMKLSVFLYL